MTINSYTLSLGWSDYDYGDDNDDDNDDDVPDILTKKMVCQSVSFWSKLKQNISQIPKNITHLIFGNAAPMAALSNYSIQYLRTSSLGSIYI